MTKNDFGPLGTVDILTSGELRETLGHQMSHTIREWFRGIDYVGAAGPGNGTGLISIPASEQGYTWSIRLVGAQLAAPGALSVYPGETSGFVAPVGVVQSVANGSLNECVVMWSSEALVIKDGRVITLLSSQTILNWRILAKQVPTEMQGKL
jgi:hypothetical protein